MISPYRLAAERPAPPVEIARRERVVVAAIEDDDLESATTCIPIRESDDGCEHELLEGCAFAVGFAVNLAVLAKCTLFVLDVLRRL